VFEARPVHSGLLPGTPALRELPVPCARAEPEPDPPTVTQALTQTSMTLHGTACRAGPGPGGPTRPGRRRV
jgi:hypothetical protein